MTKPVAWVVRGKENGVVLKVCESREEAGRYVDYASLPGDNFVIEPLVTEVAALARLVAGIIQRMGALYGDLREWQEDIRTALDIAAEDYVIGIAHVCGLEGFDDWLGDVCPGCEAHRPAMCWRLPMPDARALAREALVALQNEDEADALCNGAGDAHWSPPAREFFTVGKVRALARAVLDREGASEQQVEDAAREIERWIACVATDGSCAGAAAQACRSVIRALLSGALTAPNDAAQEPRDETLTKEMLEECMKGKNE